MIASRHEPRPRVAVVGAGIAGLVCAHRLQNVADITLFEAGERVGGHTNTVDVEWEGEQHAVDTGFIVFNTHNYPNFTALLDELGVASQPSAMSFSVRCDQRNLEYCGTGLGGLFAQRRNLARPWFHRMVLDIFRFNRTALDALSLDDDVTVDDYVRERGYGEAFVEQYLVPMGASIWSAPAGRFRRFPMRFVVEFMNHHVMLSVRGRPEWRTVTGGSQRYVDVILDRFRGTVHTATPVRSVTATNGATDIVTSRGIRERFDHVIFACHSDQALAILGNNASELERQVLGAFPYQPNEAILHTDERVLPSRRRVHAAWNYHRRADHRGDDAPVAITYHMNILQQLRSRHAFMTTLNDDGTIDPARIIARFDYAHPIYTAERAAAQGRHAELIGANRRSFCGAYWGFGFHEDGVTSALRVCDVMMPRLRETSKRGMATA